MSNRVIRLYSDQFQKMLDGQIWIDETFSKKLGDLEEKYYFKRPLPYVHSVAELVSHLLEWRLSIINILRGGKRTIADDSPANWRNNRELENIGWQSLLSVFYSSQHTLIDLLSSQDDSFIDRIDDEGRTYEYYLNGMVHHDMYHLGQIGLVLRMHRSQK